MPLDLEVADLGEMQAVPDELIAPLWIGEAVIAVATFEPRVAWGLAIHDPPKEGLHGFVQSLEHILLHLAMNVLVLFTQLLDLFQLVGLHFVGDGHPTHAIGLATLFERRVVEFFAAAQGPLQGPDLLAGGIEAKLVRLTPQMWVLGRLGPWLLWMCALSVSRHADAVVPSGSF